VRHTLYSPANFDDTTLHWAIEDTVGISINNIDWQQQAAEETVGMRDDDSIVEINEL